MKLTIRLSKQLSPVEIVDPVWIAITIGEQTFYVSERGDDSLRIASDRRIVVLPRTNCVIDLQETKL